MKMAPVNSDVEMPAAGTASAGHEAPQGKLEEGIAELWRELFHLDEVSRNANFFELGGNSLLGMDLSEMFSARLAIDVPVVVLFQYPTIREMAEVVATAS